MPLTVEEFERAYAERSGTTVAKLHAWGRYGEPCDCGDDLCEGFQMTHAWEDAIIEDVLRTGAMLLARADELAAGLSEALPEGLEVRWLT
jgi:hypothetical protein